MKNQDEAFIVLKYLFSEESQTSLYRYGKQANPPQFSPYDPESKFYAFLRDKFADFLTTTEDTNTFLRKIEDENSAILKKQLGAQ